MSWSDEKTRQLLNGEQWKGLCIYENSVWGHFEKAFSKSGFNVDMLYDAIDKYGFNCADLSMDKKLKILQEIGENRSDSDRSLTVALALVGVVFGLKVSSAADWSSVITLIVIMLVLLAALYMIRVFSESKSNKLLEAVYIMLEMGEPKNSNNPPRERENLADAEADSSTDADSGKNMNQEVRGDAVAQPASGFERPTLPKNDKQ